MDYRIKTYILVISGFTQGVGSFSGMANVFKFLLGHRRALASANHQKASSARIEFRAWNSNWKEEARYIANNTREDARIVVVAYSWGVGHGAMRLAHHLGKRGREIDTLLSCDGVSRTRLWPSWLPFNPLSVTPLLSIKVPPNVRWVKWVRRAPGNLPGSSVFGRFIRGHKLSPRSPRFTLVSELAGHKGGLPYPHGLMDQSPEFLDMVRSTVVPMLTDPT